MAALGGPPATPPCDRLRRRRDFVAAAAGTKAHSALLTLQARPRVDDLGPRLGFTVTRREGSAVERNRIRRRMRSAAAAVTPMAARAGHDYVIIARRAVLQAAFARLVADLANAFRRVHRTRSGEPPAVSAAASERA